MIYQKSVFERYGDKPIIQPKDFSGAECVFNCGQTIFEGQPLLLVSILHVSGYYRGIKGATTHVARTTDGINFEIDPEPFLQRREDFPFGSYDIENHPIDTRITKIEDTYYVIHPSSGHWGTFGILGKTTDFKKHEYIDIISLPDNRVPCLFPEKIKGMYWRLDRPYRAAPNNNHSLGNIWLSESPDLLFWGKHRPLLQAGFAVWGQEKIGPTPPIKTEKGWLTIIHGVTSSCAGRRYALGAVLLDLKNPSKIIGYTTSSLLAPDMIYEQVGRVPNVVFSCGAIADYEKRLIRLYYGCADTSIGLATANLDEVIDMCVNKK